MGKPYVDMTLAGRKVRALTASSMPEFLDLLPADAKGRSETWAGATYADALTQARWGDLSQVERSDALLSKIEDIEGLEGLRPVTVNSVTGGAPNVPAFLSGVPTAMRRRVRQVEEGGEVVLMVSAFVSQSIAHEEIVRRGAAQLALVRALSQVRPVRLYVYGAHTASGTEHKRAHFFAYPIDTAPLDLARAAWALCAPQSYRQIMLEADDVCGSSATFAYEAHDLPRAWAVEIAGAESAVVTPPLVSGDGRVPFMSDEGAADWVQKKLKEALAA